MNASRLFTLLLKTEHYQLLRHKNINHQQDNKQIIPSNFPGMMMPDTVHIWQLWYGICG